MHSWYSTFPEFGMIYELVDQDNETNELKPTISTAITTTNQTIKNWSRIVAVCIIIPIEFTDWKLLLTGDVTEKQAKPFTFDKNNNNNNNTLSQCGLHIYHVEVLQRNLWKENYDNEKFFAVWLRDLASIIGNSSIFAKSIAGLSALAVSKSGAHLFHNILGFPEIKSSTSSESTATLTTPVVIGKKPLKSANQNNKNINENATASQMTDCLFPPNYVNVRLALECSEPDDEIIGSVRMFAAENHLATSVLSEKNDPLNKQIKKDLCKILCKE